MKDYSVKRNVMGSREIIGCGMSAKEIEGFAIKESMIASIDQKFYPLEVYKGDELKARIEIIPEGIRVKDAAGVFIEPSINLIELL